MRLPQEGSSLSWSSRASFLEKEMFMLRLKHRERRKTYMENRAIPFGLRVECSRGQGSEGAVQEKNNQMRSLLRVQVAKGNRGRRETTEVPELGKVEGFR